MFIRQMRFSIPYRYYIYLLPIDFTPREMRTDGLAFAPDKYKLLAHTHTHANVQGRGFSTFRKPSLRISPRFIHRANDSCVENERSRPSRITSNISSIITGAMSKRAGGYFYIKL